MGKGVLMKDEDIMVICDDEAREGIEEIQDQIFVLEEEMRIVKTILMKILGGVSNG